MSENWKFNMFKKGLIEGLAINWWQTGLRAGETIKAIGWILAFFLVVAAGVILTERFWP